MASASIRAVYECFDGSGGPDRLSGDDIPLAARVTAVALAFDRLTGDQASGAGQGLSAEEAIARLKGPECRGEFDPDVLGALLRAHRSGNLMVPW